MANEVLFAGGRLDSFAAIIGTASEATTAGSFDATYADAATTIVTSQLEATFLADDNTPFVVADGNTIYVHFEGWHSSGNGNPTWEIALKDAAGHIWVGLRRPAQGSQLALYYNSGTGVSPVYTQIGPAFNITGGVRYEYDLKVSINSTGNHVAEFSINRTLQASGSWAKAEFTSVERVRIESPNYAGAIFGISQVLVTLNRSSIGGKVKYSRATGAGGNSGWTGAYTNVNEPVNSEGTFDAAASAGLRQSYAMGDVTVLANYAIAGVFYSIRGKNDGVSPLNIAPIIRQSSVDYDGSNFAGIGTSSGALTAKYVMDPASAAVWSQTTFNSAEFGYLSAA